MDNTLIQAGLASAETLINQALAYDPASQQKLARMADKILALDIQQPGIKLYVRMGPQLQLLSHIEEEASATLSGELSAFLNVAKSKDKHQALMQSDLQIMGSSQLALSLADLMNDLDIDWEAMLAKFIGPVAAHLLGKQVRGFSSWIKQAGDKLINDGISYLRDEKQVVAHEQEGEQRYRQIHQLRMDTERLDARIQRLAAKLKQS